MAQPEQRVEPRERRIVTLPAPVREWLMREFRCPDCGRLVMRAYIPAGGKAEIACPRCKVLIEWRVENNCE